MAETLEQLTDDFWTIRGEFRIGGAVNIGTQSSLVKLASGDFVFLDSYTLPDDIRAEVAALTDGGSRVAAILNLHPFHTIHCEWMHQAYPDAQLFGTARHLEKLPALPWQDALCESSGLAEKFGDDFAFSVPRGVPLVCDDESVHFSSVLAYHRSSGTIHVDDTFVYFDRPPFSHLPGAGRLQFHPTLNKALEPRQGAADDLREWAIEIGTEWNDARRIVIAHDKVAKFITEDFATQIGAALGAIKPKLDKHRKAFE